MKQDVAEFLTDSFIDFKGNVHRVTLCALSQSPESTDGDYLMVAWSDGETVDDTADIYNDVYRTVSLGMAICCPADEKAFSEEIGKKIAQRVILELKDKLAKAEDELSFSGVSGAAMPAVVQGDKAKEAAAALSVLGYGPAEINMALKGVDMASLTLEEIIRQALKHMVK